MRSCQNILFNKSNGLVDVKFPKESQFVSRFIPNLSPKWVRSSSLPAPVFQGVF